MDKVELMNAIDKDIDELLSLKKSWDEKMASEGAAESTSDAQSDMVHAADEGEKGKDLSSYANQLSDEELYEIMACLSQEADNRGIGQDSGNAPAEGAQAEAGSEAPAVEESSTAESGEGAAPEADAQASAEAAEAGEAAAEAGEQPADTNGAEAAGSLEEKVAGLSDEELKALMEALMKEESKRGSQEQAAPAEKNMDMGASSSEMAMMKSFQENLEAVKAQDQQKFEAMMNSIKDLSEKIEQVVGKVSTLEKSTNEKKKEAVVTAARYPASKTLKVLEKSSTGDEPALMTGGELASWLLSEQRSGNKKINSNLVTMANLAKSEEEITSFYSEMKRLGLNPKK